MKKSFLLLLLSLAFYPVMSSDWTGIRSDEPKPAVKELISSTAETQVIHFALDGFLINHVTTPLGDAIIIGLEEATPVLIKGAPDLPKLTASVIIPDLAEMRVEVIEAQYRDYENIFVAPSKGNLTRDIDPSTVPYEFGAEYSQDAFFPGTLTGLRDPYIIRDYRGQTIVVYPFQYNPVSKILRVYTDITVRLSRVNDHGINPLVRQQPVENIDGQFNRIYNQHFLNAGSSRYAPVDEFGKILVICYNAFMNEMQPWILWKKQVGYPIEMADVASIGNSTAIKSFIADYYNTKGLTFVLLVGDGAQVPTSSTSAGDSDNDYTYIVGNDHYPDLFIGRFSAETVDQVNTQVQRTLKYEQDPLISTDWFTVATGIGSDQGPGDDNELDYQHIRNIGTDLLNFTYTYANELFDGSQGGNDDPGNPSPSQVADDVNAGTSIINYCGHGSQTSWGTSGFSNSDVNNLTNHNMLPFIFSVACVNGDFVNSTCFAEAWLRATDNGQPTGAIAFLGSTINQSWNPPMCGEDEMDDILVESYQDNIRRTFAAISMEGCMKMNDEYGSGGDEMTDTWTCFGDPSLVVRTAFPLAMTVSHDPVLFIGATQLLVICNAEGARATLSMDGTFLGSAIVEGGTATISFAQLNNIGTVTLTITAFNYLPYIADIDVVPAAGPYVVMESYQVDDASGNNNGLVDYSEAIDLAVELKNVGVEDATDVLVTLSTSDPYITITDNSEIYPLIPAGQTVTIENAFGFDVSSDIPDQHSVIFNLNSTDGDNNWQSTFLINVNAPVLKINGLDISDLIGGDGDGILDPGENAEITINYSNSGHAVAYNVNVYLEGQSGFIEIADPNQGFTSIGFFGVFNKTFSTAVDQEAPEGILVNFMNELTMGDFLMDKNFPLKISPKCEDFETGDFTKFNWQFSGNQPWQIISDYPFEGNHSAKSGTITHSQTTELKLNYEVMTPDSITFYRKVSSEPGDLLRFYINTTMIAEWSGTTGGWHREAFAVGSGNKTFKWIYQKNGIGTAGADAGWLDFIIMPPPMALTIWAGPDDFSCKGSAYQLSEAYGTDFTSIAWTSSGTGTLNNNTVIHPIYTPSQQDLDNGQVVLTLTLWDNEGNTVTDQMTLKFTDVPGAPAAPSGPSYVNLEQTQTSEYTTDGIEGISEYNWYVEPQEAGTFAGNTHSATITWNPSFFGTANITVRGINDCGEGVPSEAFPVTVDNVVGLTEPGSAELAIEVYPNPVKGNFFIKVNDLKDRQANVSIYNLLGEKVYENNSIRFNQSSASLDASFLREGIYILTVSSVNGKVVTKLVVH